MKHDKVFSRMRDLSVGAQHPELASPFQDYLTTDLAIRVAYGPKPQAGPWIITQGEKGKNVEDWGSPLGKKEQAKSSYLRKASQRPGLSCF